MLAEAMAAFTGKEPLVKDWNVVVSVFQDGYSRALRALQKLGATERSPYHNVLVMKVADRRCC